MKSQNTFFHFYKKRLSWSELSWMGGVLGSMKFLRLVAYSSSIGAVITLTKLMAEKCKVSGSGFNVLALGIVQTELLEVAIQGFIAPPSAFQMADYIKEFTLKENQFYDKKLLQISSSYPKE